LFIYYSFGSKNNENLGFAVLELVSGSGEQVSYWKILNYYTLWQYRLWSFQGSDTKLERFLAKNQL
jgi:hypothetical protein